MADLSTDIYGVASILNKLALEHTDEEEETLAVGIYGYFTSLMSKTIKNSIAVNSELYRESFTGKAKFEKNIIIQAIQNNVDNITATPAQVPVLIGVPYSSITKVLAEQDEFIFDSDYEYQIEDYSFRLDYDISLTMNESYSDEPIFSAMYNIINVNKLSDVTSPILNTPTTMILNSEKYIFISCTVRQVSKTQSSKKILSNEVVENKTMIFTFSDQLASFTVIVVDTNGNNIELTPIFEGQSTDKVEYYCYYAYIDYNTIRLKFDYSSYALEINSEILVDIYTTKGASGNFDYTSNLYYSVDSEEYGYNNIPEVMITRAKSEYGVNRKSKEELINAIPKKLIEKDSIITERDINTYFEDKNINEFKLTIKKKIHNVNSHEYYAYTIGKNINNNIVQTSTVDIYIPLEDLSSEITSTESLNLQENYTLCNYRVNIDGVESVMPFVINIYTNPLTCFYYFPIINIESYLNYLYINSKSPIQYIANRISFYRQLESSETNFLTNEYYLDLNITQSINTNTEISVLDEETGEYIHKIRAYLVFYYNNTTQCYLKADLVSFDPESFIYGFKFKLETNNKMDKENAICLTNTIPAGATEVDELYLNIGCTSNIYIVDQFSAESYGRYDIDDIIPGLEEWTVCNVYSPKDDIHFLYNFTSRVKSDISVNIQDNILKGFNISKVPVLQNNVFMTDDDNNTNILNFSSNLVKFIGYLDDIELLTENSFESNMKFYKTVGKSSMFYTDKDYTIPLSSLSLKLVFNVNLVSSKDTYLKDIIISEIKSTIEALSDTGSDIHFNNICSDIKSNYSELINYIEINTCNKEKVFHIYKNPDANKFLIPEFVSIDTYKDSNNEIKPYISINFV